MPHLLVNSPLDGTLLSVLLLYNWHPLRNQTSQILTNTNLNFWKYWYNHHTTLKKTTHSPPRSLGNSLSVWYTVNKTSAFVQSKSHVITLLGSLFLIISSNICPAVRFIVWYKPLWSWWLPSCSSMDSLRYKDFGTRPPSCIRVWNRRDKNRIMKSNKRVSTLVKLR